MHKRQAKALLEEIDRKELHEFKPLIHKITFFIGLTGGFIILMVGLFLTITERISIGRSIGGKFSPGGELMTISGPGIVIIGITILLFMLYFYRQNRKLK